MRGLIALVALSLAVRAQGGGTNALLLGNSYTGVKNVPALFAGLAQSGGHGAMVGAHTPGGNTLGYPQSNGNQHESNPTSLSKIVAQAWDVLVLQEQSFLPTVESAQELHMKTGAAYLDAALHAAWPAARTMM